MYVSVTNVGVRPSLHTSYHHVLGTLGVCSRFLLAVFAAE